MKIRKLLPLWFTVIALSACQSKQDKPVLIPEVTVVMAQQSDLPLYAEYVGQAYGLSDVLIQARVQGLITGMFFKEGAYIKMGDLLYTIDDLPYQAKVAEAEGRLADAESELTRAQNDLSRVKPLVESNALSKRDLDAAIAAVGAAEGRVKAAKATRTNALIELSYCKVTAPVSGVIGISQVRTGDFVGSFNTKSLNTISDVSKMRIRFPISENDYLHFLEVRKQRAAHTDTSKHVQVDLYLSNGELYPSKAAFNITNREIDPTTGSLTIEALVDNNEGVLRPGQYIKVKFPAEMMNNAIIIPQRAVLQLQNLFQVCVLGDSNKVSMRMIKVGPRVGEWWVVTEGIKPNEPIVILGNKVVKPNSVVKPIFADSSAQVQAQP